MKPVSYLSAACLSAALLFSNHSHAQWTNVGAAGFSPSGLSNWQHLMIDADNNLYVSFNDEGTTGQGTVMRYDGTTWVSVGAPGFTTGFSHHSWFDKSAAGTYYYSYANGDDMSKAAVMRYNGTAWSSIGTSLSIGECQYSQIKVINDTAYLGFIDNGVGGSVNVLKYNGTSWVPVGGGTISAGPATYLSMTTDRHDTLYVAYQETSAGGGVSVKKFDGSSWVTVGSGPFLSMPFGSAYNISLAFDHANYPHVAYWNPAPMGPSASVQKFDGSTWVNVGSPSFTTTIVNFTSLAFGTNDTPYLAFTESTAGNKASVMKFDGTTWNYVGAPAFSGATAAYTSLAADGNGNLYVAFFDEANGNKTSVMKYQTCMAPAISAFTATDTDMCLGDTVTINLTGTLGDATQWEWHTGSCAGALADTGTSVTFTPGDTTTYYVRGLGGCVASGACTAVTINVDVLPVPAITATGAVLTSSAATGNQWMHLGAIAGATGNTYTVTQTGWYSVSVTNGHCTQTSDSVYVIGVGVPDVSLAGNIVLYPVPAEDVVTINIAGNIAVNAGWQMHICDNVGRVVAQQPLMNNKTAIDIQMLPAGMYQLIVTSPLGKQAFKLTKSAR